MSGNVLEWCRDRYWLYSDKAQKDPKGVSSEYNKRVLRGGSWNDDANSLRSAKRESANQSIRDTNIGFRVVLPYFLAQE